MATSKSLAYGPWILFIVLAVWICPTMSAECTLEPAQDVIIDIPEELPIGAVLVTFTVDPPDSTIEYSCETDFDPPTVCQYLERDGLNVIMKSRFDIEDPDLDQSRLFDNYPGREGFIIYYFDAGSTSLFSCTPPGGSDFDKTSRVIQRPIINNVNEPPIMSPMFTTHVAELALGATELVFDTDVFTQDVDINLDTDPDRVVFDCTLLDEDAPFYVSDCTNEFDPITSRAENIAKLSVAPPPPTLDYESRNYYNVTLQISDLADFYGRVNKVNTTLYISIDDLDDQDPEFNHPSFTTFIDENLDSVKLTIDPEEIDAVDRDTLNAEISYRFSDIEAPKCQDSLTINRTTAELTVTKAFDREESGICQVDVVAYQTFNEARFSIAELTVTINDINDNCPEFEYPAYDGIVTIEDLYVMNNETMERMMITTTDADVDLPFEGLITIDFKGADDVFEMVEEQLEGENSKQVYIKLIDPGKLDTTKTYEFEISVNDNSIPCPSYIYTSIIIVRPVDLSVRFDQPFYTKTIGEDFPFGDIVIQVSAVTWDGVTEGIMYRLTEASNNGLLVFEMNDATGEIKLISRELDATKISEYVLFIEAEDRRGQPVRRISSTVTVFVADTNNKCPKFLRDAYFAEISASDVYAVEVGTLKQLTLAANDSDTEITYTDVSITSGNEDNIFELEKTPSTGPQLALWFVRLAEPLLLVDGLSYNLTVTLTDTTSLVTCQQEVIDVTIRAADLSPVFSLTEYTGTVGERAAKGTFVVKVEATSYNNEPDNIFYTIKSANNHGSTYFEIDRLSGDVTVKDDTIDAETVKEFTLVVQAEDRSTQPPRTASTTVIITVQNLNDWCPNFDKPSYSGTITPQDKYVIETDGTLDRLVLTTVDNDKVYSGSVTLVDDADGIFGIEQSILSDGSASKIYIVLRDPVRLGLDSYDIVLSITDNSLDFPSLPVCDNKVAGVNIAITADLSPVFDTPPEGYRAYLPENTPSGEDVIMISARSYDGSIVNIVYQLKSGSDDGLSLFAIDRTTGVIVTISGETDYETIPEYTLVVEAQDRGTEPFRSSTTTVIVSLNNTNDECPMFELPSYTGQITLQDLYVTDEDTLERLVLVATDADMDFVGDIEIVQRGDNDGIFELQEDRSVMGMSRVSIKLVDDDLLGLPQYTLQILASDSTAVNGKDCSGTPIEVTINVASDLAPIFSGPEYSAVIVEGSPFGTTVVKIEATSQSGSLDIIYIKKSVSNDGDSYFDLDRVTGQITLGTAQIDYEAVKEYTIVVEAQDRGSEPFRTATTTVTVTITNANDECPRFDSDHYVGTVTPQDKYVIDNDGSLDRLILMTVDADMRFDGVISLMDSSDGIFGIEHKPNTDGSAREVYVTLLDPTKLGLDFYTVLVSITDSSLSACDVIVANVSIIITADLSPVFIIPPGGYRDFLPENTPAGVDVIEISARSYNGSAVNIVYQLKSGSDDGLLFAIDRNTGVIVTISDETDYETIPEYTLVVEAQDRGTEPFRSSTTTVIISVTNENDECPVFDKGSYSGQITLQDLYVTNSDTLDRLVLVATDADMNFTGSINFSSDGDGVFILEEDRSLLGMSRVSIKLLDDDLLTNPQYNLQISATDPMAIPSCPGVVVPVVIKRVADLAPNFTEPEYSGTIVEGSSGVIVTIEAVSEGDQADIIYILKSVSNNGGDLFVIGRKSGEVSLVSNATDYESLTQYTLVVEAQDRGVEPFRSSTTTVFVYLNDTDDNCPEFSADSYNGRITPQDLFVVTGSGGTERLVIEVHDEDTEFIGDIALSPGEGDGIFEIVTNLVDEGRSMDVYIQLVDPQLLTDSKYNLFITLASPCGAVVPVTIDVVTNLAPVFDEGGYIGVVPEGALPDGTVIVQVNATSQNTGTSDILYNFKSGSNGGLLIFDIDKVTGAVTLISDGTDYEKYTEYTLVVEAQDRGTEPPRSSTTVVVITIEDENDNCPYFNDPEYLGQITTQDVYVVEQGGVESLRLKASDDDTMFSGSAQISEDSSGGAFGLEMTGSSGNEWRITLDDNSLIADGQEYSLTVEVTDTFCSTPESTSVTINVIDLSPTFSPKEYDTLVEEDVSLGAFVVQVRATNKDGTTDGITYYINWASGDGEFKFRIDANTGVITVGGEINADAISQYTISVVAQDGRLEPPRSGTGTVYIQVTDTNDLCPEFEVATYDGSMSPEDTFVSVEDGSERLRIVAIDGDISGFNGSFSIDPSSSDGFGLLPTENPGERFIQVTDSSLINLGANTLVVRVIDNTIVPNCADVTVVTVTVSDEFIPKFENDTYVGSVPEGSGIGVEVIQVIARNRNGDSDGIVYRIITGNNDWQDYFRIDRVTGKITVISVDIDAELMREFTLFVEAVDTTLQPERSGTTTVVIGVGDINDQCPFFVSDTYAGSLQQGETFVQDPIGRLIIRAVDGDQMFNGSVAVTTPDSPFELTDAPVLSPNTKDFYLITRDQALSINVYEVMITVLDDFTQRGTPCQTNETIITVSVTPSSDVPPSFVNDTYKGTVPEGADSDGEFIVKVEARNNNGTNFGISYLIVSASNEGEKYFRVDVSSGEVYVSSPNIDAEDVSEFTLFIEARDTRQTPVLSDTATVVITIEDINDNTPKFKEPSYDATLPEDARNGYVVITVIADDADQTSTIEYRLVSDPGYPFAIDPTVGAIIVSGELDADKGDVEYDLQVEASDGLNVAVVIVTVIISDVNDNPPVCDPKTYDLIIEENDNNPASIQIIATDEDDVGRIIYDLQSPLDKNIVVDPNSGIVTFNGPYDRETDSVIVAIIIVKNDGEPPLMDTAEVTLTITDVNDEEPYFQENGCGAEVQVSEGAVPGFTMCSVLAVDDDEEGTADSEITYTLIGSGSNFFRIEKNVEGRGLLKVDMPLDRETQQQYQIQIEASDGGTPRQKTTLDITIQVTDINDQSPQFSQPNPEYQKSFQNEVESGTEVISVMPLDGDELPAYKTILCNLTSTDGSHEYFYVISDGTVCTIFTQLDLKVRPMPYVITIITYNPDKPNLQGNNRASLSVFVSLDDCIVIIEPTDYNVKQRVGDINEGDEVVRVRADSSPCGVNGIVFNITKQTLTATPYVAPEPSMEFEINPETGVISAIDNNPSFGTHNMEVIAFNASKENTNTDSGYVSIVVIPNTNTPPSFDSPVYYADPVLAPKLADYLVIDLEKNATDDDHPFTAVGEIEFEEVSEKRDDNGAVTNYFYISKTGQVKLVGNILELPDTLTIEMIVKVVDNGLDPLEDTASVFIDIEPPIAAPPVFVDGCTDTIYVLEGASLSTYLCKVSAEGGSKITYSIDDTVNFNINRDDGTIVTNKIFDFEDPAEKQFKILVTATSSDGLTATTGVNVVVNDTNDSAPKFVQGTYEYSIAEDVASGGCTGKYVGVVQATDADTNPEFKEIVYSIVEPYDFSIDPKTGVIETTECIDRESSPYESGQINIVVKATNPGVIPILDDDATVHITIVDQNDNDPVFQQDTYPVLMAGLLPSVPLVTVVAEDIDVGVNAELYYLIAQEQKGIIYEFFSVDRITGVVSTTAQAILPPGESLEETILVEVWDSGFPPRNDVTEVIVSVTPGYLNDPIYMDQRQKLFFKENELNQCEPFNKPLYDESLVIAYTITNDTSYGKFNVRYGNPPTICNTEPLDYEEYPYKENPKYYITVESLTCNPDTDLGCSQDVVDPNMWIGRMTRDAEQDDNIVTPNALQSNQVVLEVYIIDVNDEQPGTRGFIEGLPNKYYIGIADNVEYNTTIFQIDAFDSDADNFLLFELSEYREDFTTPTLITDPAPALPCPLTNTNLQLNQHGGLESRGAMYSYLNAKKTDISTEQLACEMVVKVTDKNTDAAYMEKSSVSVPAKIKVLYAFEHAIIILDSPPEVVVPQAVQIANCLSLGMKDYVLKVEYVRAEFKKEKNGVTHVNPDRTDLWVYAIHREKGTFAKYWEIKEAWDASRDARDLCVWATADMVIGIRPAYLKRDYMYPYPAIVGWCVVALACLISLAALICMFILFESWEKMIVERTTHISTVMLGLDSYGLHADVVDTGAATMNEYEWDRSMPLVEREQKLALFESQEIIMDFMDDKYLMEEEEGTSFIREQKSATEVTVFLNNQDWLEEKEEIKTVHREMMTQVATMDFEDDISFEELPMVEASLETKGTDISGKENNVKGLVSYFSTAGPDSNSPEHVYDTPYFVHPPSPASENPPHETPEPVAVELNIEIQDKDSNIIVHPSSPSVETNMVIAAEVGQEIQYEKESDSSSSSSSSSSSDEESDSEQKAADTNVAIYEETLPQPSGLALVSVEVNQAGGTGGAHHAAGFRRSTSSSMVKKEQGQTAGEGSYSHYESTITSSSTTVISTNAIPPAITQPPELEIKVKAE